jgi:hypothetical protein
VFADCVKLVQAGAVKVTVDGFHANGEAEALGEASISSEISSSSSA